MAKKKSAKAKPKGGYTQEIVSLIRAALSAILLAAAYTVNAAAFVSGLMLAAAVVICGLDIVISGIEKLLKRKDYFNYQLIISLCAAVCLCIGCYVETIVMLSVWQAGNALLSIAIRKTKADFYASASAKGREDSIKVRSLISSQTSYENSVMSKAMPYLDLFSKAALIVGVLFAAFIPLITDMTYVMSIRRGCMLIAAALPASALAALPIYSLAGISRAADYGVLVKDAKTLEAAGKLAAVIYDKSGVLTDGAPKLVSLNSPVLDNSSFLMLAAHAAYSSEQHFAASIVSAYSGDIYPSYISDFKDIPGCGTEISLNGRHVLLGTLELFDARGIPVPDADKKDGYLIYLAVESKYVGSMTFKENVNPYAECVISDLAKMGGVKSIMVSEDGREISERLSKTLNVNELYCECGFSEKANIIKQSKSQLTQNETVMYISAENLDYHTAADIDANISLDFNNADMIMSSIGIFGLPVVYDAACKVKRLSIQNLIFTVIIKLALVILALTGCATLWFVIAGDFAASILGVLNAIRIGNSPDIGEQ